MAKIFHGVHPIINNNEYEENFISDHEFNLETTDIPRAPQLPNIMSWPYETLWEDDDEPDDAGLEPYYLNKP